MNTWIIGHAPVGHRVVLPEYTKEDSAPTKAGTKTFFMKARIMAGQANLKGNPFGLSDYKWLTKEEVQKHVSDHYFSWVKNMMADR
jgi:large subunit ribosomal protein L46